VAVGLKLAQPSGDLGSQVKFLAALWSHEQRDAKCFCGCGMNTRWAGARMKPMTRLGLAGFTIVCCGRGPIGCRRHNSHENCKLRNGTLPGCREDWQDSPG
jgi:hypothetical protein